jgi:hypothetical protein
MSSMTPSDLAALREALEWYDAALPWHNDHTDTMADVARRLLAVEESAVPLAERIDYEAAEQAFAEWADDTSPDKAVRRIVDAALGDISDAVIYPGEPE